MRRLILAVSLAVSLPAAGAEELKPALRATARVTAPAGAPVAAIAPRVPFTVEVVLENLAGPEPPAGLRLFGWLRRITPGDPPCQQAAQAFLRTGALPAGAVFLNDPVIGMATEDAAFTIADPEFSLATANLLAASRFPTLAASLAADEAGRRFLLPFPAEGLVRAVTASGVVTEAAAGLDRPVAAAAGADGSLWIGEEGGRLVRVTAEGRAAPVATGVATLRGAADQGMIVAGGPGGVTAFAASGAERVHRAGASLDAIPLGSPAFALALLDVGGVSLVYLDAPEDIVAVPLPAAATRLAATDDGRVLVAWSPAGGPAVFIDVARARVVQASRAPVPISEVAFTSRTAALMLADQSRVGTLDLVSLLRDGTAEMRETPIGQARARPLDHEGLLAPLRATDGLLAVHSESGQGIRIEEAAALGNAPPMTAARLRGGVPRYVATLDRSFREEAPGVFRTTASLPAAGRFELVATTGLGALSFCAALPVAEPDDPAARDAPGRIAVTAGEPGGLRLVVSGPDGKPLAHVSGTLTFAALTGAWRARAPFESDAEGRSRRAYPVPAVGEVVVTLTARAPGAPPSFSPLIVQEAP